MPWWAGKLPCFLEFWTLHSPNGAGVLCERVMHQGSDTAAMLLAPSQVLAVWPHFLLSLSQVCIACLIPQLLKQSIFIHLCGFLSLSLNLTMIYLLAAPCQKGSFAWTLSLDKGLLKIGSRATVLTYHCIGNRSITEMRNSHFLFVFLLWFCFPPDFLACGEKVYLMH